MQTYNVGFTNETLISSRPKEQDQQARDWLDKYFFPQFPTILKYEFTPGQYDFADVYITGRTSDTRYYAEVKTRHIFSTTYTAGTAIEEDKIKRIEEEGKDRTYLIILFRDGVAYLPPTKFYTAQLGKTVIPHCPDEYQPGKWRKVDKPAVLFDTSQFTFYNYRYFGTQKPDFV